MVFVCIVLAVILVFVLVRHLHFVWQIKSINEQIEFINTHETNKIVTGEYRTGIEKQVNPLWENEVSATHSANVKRMIDLVDAEITGINRLLESCNKNA